MHAVAIVGGLITSIQWSIWVVKFARKVFKSCFKTPTPEPTFNPEILLELMGDSRTDLEAAVSVRRARPGVRYTKGTTDSEDKAKMSPPLNRL